MTIGTGRDLPTGVGEESDGRVRRLSFAQEQLWFLNELAPGQTTYNILMVWRLHGPLRVDLLQRCVNLVVARHESLRVTIRNDEGTPYQVVAPAAEVPLPVTDLRALPEAEREQRVQAEIDAQRAEPYDLETGPLCRFRLLRLDAEEYVFCQGFHHIITDGWSAAVVNAELSTAYRSLCSGTEPAFEDLELDYTEFAESQRERLQGDALTDELAFWQQTLADLPVLELPADRPRPTGGSHHGETLIKDFPDDLRGIVQQLADDHGASMFMVFAAACNLVLSRYTGLEDIPIGVPMLGRPEPELEPVVGMFINMVVLRSDLSGDPTFSELIDRIADSNLELYDHQEVSFNQVVDAVQPVRDPDRNPLFQVSVQLLGESNSGENLSFPEVVAEFVPLASLDSRFDIALNIIDTGSSLRANAEYSSDMFDRWRMEAMLTHLETVLRTAAADPSLPLSRIPIVVGAEAEQLLSIGRGEVVGYSRQPLHVAVAEVARRQPDAVAVVCDGVGLSHRELDRRAGLLARHLRAKGLRHGQVVAVAIDRDLDAYVTMLGILKAGAAFALLDPELPAGRMAFVIGDTAAPLVITRSGIVERLPESTGWQTVLIDTDWPAVEAITVDGPLEEWATADTPACVLYTSDSTGRPIGVVIAHRAVSFFCEAYRRTFDFGPDDRLLHLPSLSSGMSQGELWTGLLSGATVVAVSPEEAASPERLAALIRDQRVTYAGLPRAVQSVIDADACPDLKYVTADAQGLPPELVNKWNTGTRRYVNLYGPTEAAIACVEYECPQIEWQTSPPMGRPHVNRQIYVVDRAMNLVPRGVAGELLIGGEPGGLATGYLNQPELTAEKFIDDPFHPGRLVHRSGDLVRWTSDLQIEFLGRVDDQVHGDAAPDPVEAETDEDGYDEPRTPTEQSIAGIFGEVLSLPRVGAEDSFFDVGGNSLQAMRAVSRINKGFGIKLSVRTLYGNVTVRAVSAVVDEKMGGKPA
ncbi:condensation domain-containing protein [Streptomyces sp.]|uniref:condensation domain-containing protein n=1 Tax=Streptomyces sp. TaxID=1931 RepID=UPI002F423553